MELENKGQENIPAEILKIVTDEVSRYVMAFREEDPLTAEFNDEFELDYKKAQYQLLTWIKKSFSTERVAYAGSGCDILPKLVLGEDRVIHVSMEEYENDKTKYFPKLGDGLKIVADNVRLPFPDSSFDMVLFFGLFTETSRKQLLESVRVVTEGGLIVCDKTISENIDLPEILDGFEKIEVPEYFLNKGISETSFTVYKK